MTEMVERVAKAIISHLEAGFVSPRKLGEVAIEALREPTKAMERAGNDIETPCDMCMGSIVVADEVWKAMIDQALKG